jgi:hypothetical protein
MKNGGMDLVEGSTTSEAEEAAHGTRAGYVGALTTP